MSEKNKTYWVTLGHGEIRMETLVTEQLKPNKGETNHVPSR